MPRGKKGKRRKSKTKETKSWNSYTWDARRLPAQIYNDNIIVKSDYKKIYKPNQYEKETDALFASAESSKNKNRNKKRNKKKKKQKELIQIDYYYNPQPQPPKSNPSRYYSLTNM